MEEKRRFGRIPFGSTVQLQSQGIAVEGALEDISLNGARVRLAGDEHTISPDDLVFSLSLTPDGPTLCFPAQVMHSEDGCVGLRFTAADPESFSHLIRLLELNTGDEEQLERELRELSEAFRTT